MKIHWDNLLFIPILALITSILLSYSYLDFKYNMSVAAGQVFTAHSLAKTGNFNVDEYPGNAGFDAFEYKDHRYTPYPPANPVFMAVPYFFVRGSIEVYNRVFPPMDIGLMDVLESIALGLPSSIAYAGIATILILMLKRYRIKRHVIILVSVSTLFSTVLLNYSVSFFHHIIAAFFIFIAFYLLENNKKSNKIYAYAGVFAGLAFLTEFPAAMFCIAVFIQSVYLWYKKKHSLEETLFHLLSFGLTFAVSIIILGLYNWAHFDSPFTFGEQLLYQRYNGSGHTFTNNPIVGLYGLYMSPLKGLFLISPALIFSVAGIYTYWNKNSQGAVLLVSYLIVVSVLYALWPDCYGFSTFGSRFLITIIPLLGFLSSFCLKGRRSILTYTVLSVYGLYICFFNLLDGIPSGTWFFKCNLGVYGSYYKATNQLKEVFDGNKDYAPVIIQEIIER